MNEALYGELDPNLDGTGYPQILNPGKEQVRTSAEKDNTPLFAENTAPIESAEKVHLGEDSEEGNRQSRYASALTVDECKPL